MTSGFSQQPACKARFKVRGLRTGLTRHMPLRLLGKRHSSGGGPRATSSFGVGIVRMRYLRHERHLGQYYRKYEESESLK